MPTFNMAQTPNGQPAGAEVYSNGIPHTYPGRKLASAQIPRPENRLTGRLIFQTRFSYQFRRRDWRMVMQPYPHILASNLTQELVS